MSEARRRLEYEVVRRKDRGESSRGIARALRIDRKTVRRILLDNERRREDGGGDAARPPRAPRRSKIDPFRGFVAEQLLRYPDLHATRLHEMLRDRGFDGGYSIVRLHLHKVRPVLVPPESPKGVARPGKKGEVDWAHLQLADGTKVYALLCTLVFSRHQYIELCADMRQPTLLRALRRAFEAQGGVVREYVFDSMPGIVNGWEGGKPILNLLAMDFAAHYRFSYDIAPPRCPKYKAIVERNVRGLRSGFLNGRTLLDLDSANAALRHWLDRTRNPSKHPQRSESRGALLAQEGLRALPLHPYDTREMAWRLVDGYGYARFEHNFYRAPSGRVGSWVCVRAGEQQVELYDRLANRLAVHERAPRGAGVHVPPPQTQQQSRRHIEALLDRFAAWGHAAHAFARKLRRTKRYGGLELARVVELQESWRLDDLLRALEHAARYGAYDADAVRRILEAQAVPRTLNDRISERSRSEIRRMMAAEPVKQREIAAYGRLLAGPGTTPKTPEEEADGPSEQPHGPGSAEEDP